MKSSPVICLENFYVTCFMVVNRFFTKMNLSGLFIIAGIKMTKLGNHLGKGGFAWS